ncbi:hypothetical protein [Marinicrinis lubricantis]|uniref:Uncharacterized protein n=1 Tax=Marinicrinis lubricantis TaxID=2086470 RepID=A0ABW1IQR2_9BACL
MEGERRKNRTVLERAEQSVTICGGGSADLHEEKEAMLLPTLNPAGEATFS